MPKNTLRGYCFVSMEENITIKLEHNCNMKITFKSRIL